MIVAQHQRTPSEQELAVCVDLTKTALRLGESIQRSSSRQGTLSPVPGGQLEEGIAIIDQSLGQNPNSADALSISGVARAFLGDTETAFRHLKLANRLSRPTSASRYDTSA